jgi:hypothetical protein
MKKIRYGVICNSTGEWLASSFDYDKIAESKKNSLNYTIVEAVYEDLMTRVSDTRPKRPFLTHNHQQHMIDAIKYSLNCRCVLEPIRRDKMFKEGQQVFSLIHGYGRIHRVEIDGLKIIFYHDSHKEVLSYTLEGKADKRDTYQTLFFSKREAKMCIDNAIPFPALTIDEIRTKAVHNQTIFVDSNGKEREYIGITKQGSVLTQYEDERANSWTEAEIQANKWYIK